VAKVHKVSSKQIAGMFKAVVDAYQEQEDSDNDLLCEAEHVDGTMNAAEKEEKLDLAQGRATAEHLPHPQQRPLPQ
jgi:predicted helicase